MKNSVDGIRVNGGIIASDLKEIAPPKPRPNFRPGDTVKVYFRIQEGGKERIQVYEGIVISIRGEGLSNTFIVRRISHEIGVERIFPYYSPAIQKIEVVRRGRVRRARLFYLRGKAGRKGRVREIFHSPARLGRQATSQPKQAMEQVGAEGVDMSEKGEKKGEQKEGQEEGQKN